MNVTDAISYRRSVRGFLNKPVDIAVIENIIERAARAASGGNLQPWHVDLVHGESIAKLKAVMRTKLVKGPIKEKSEYRVYPPELSDPYDARRRDVAEMLYTAIGISRDDRRKRLAWFYRNFEFFDAPVGLFISLERYMGPPQWADAGMFLQNICLLLCEAGLDSCPQECWAIFPKTMRTFLQHPDERILWTGLAIGYKDEDHAANSLLPSRAPLEEWFKRHI